MARISFLKNQNVIITDVLIQSGSIKKRVKMALDTGATYVMVPWQIAEVLGLKPELSRNRIEMITASGVEKVPIVHLPVVRVGQCVVKNVKAMVHDLPVKSYVDGLQ